MLVIENFVGRKKELEDLKELFLLNKKNKSPILIGIDGIRKVGKTTFVKKFIENNSDEINDIKLFFTGDFSVSKYKNISHVINVIKTTFKSFFIANGKLNEYEKEYISYSKLYNNQYKWNYVFNYLQENLIFLKKHFPNSNIFVFFDEISWYDKNGDFISEFARFWNIFGHVFSNLNIFMASSVSIWANEKAFKNTGTLFERFNRIIQLQPFSLMEIKQLIKKQNPNIEDIYIIYYYFIFGGIIKYYLDSQWINYKISFEENVKRISNKDYFIQEYDNLFQGILSDKKNYQEIIEILCSSKSLSSKQIFEKIKKEKGYKYSYQYLMKQLQELEVYFFIKKSSSYGENYYHINHLLSYFIYYWIYNKENNRKINQLYEFNQDFSTWKGNALEIFLANNLNTILKELNINKGTVDYYLNFLVKDESTKIASQIDLLIDETYSQKRIKDNQKYFILIECKNYEENKHILPYKEAINIEYKNKNVENFFQKKYKKHKIVIRNILFSLFPLNVPEEEMNIKNISLIELINK